MRKIIRRAELQITEADRSLQWIGPQEGERIANEVAGTLMALDAITMDTVQTAKLDAQRLAYMLRTASPGVVSVHSEKGRYLYERLLVECCLHLVEFFTRRPEFLARSVVEQSRELADIRDRLADREREFSQYEERYCQGVIALNNEIQLFGLGLPPAHQAYELTTAYVSLTVQRIGGTGDHSRPEAQAANEDTRFEDLLINHSRLLVEGQAGAGKTTLLMRLALHMCRGDLPEQLREWRNSVPFLLRLRTLFANGKLSLPQPDTFASATARPAPREPRGWAASVLDSGRAAVLVDGIDEVPEEFRSQVSEWLEQLSRYYPDAKYVVTSRPAALGDANRQTLRNRGFVTGRLEPMTIAQVNDFIDRWHQAAMGNEADANSVMRHAEELKDTLSSRRDLSRLATNPLLCAMLCALNRNHNSDLPQGRIALYRAAFTMLLDRRDREKHIPAGPVRLSQDQSQAFLARMAMWMTLNGRRTIANSEALGAIEDVLPRLRIRGLSEEQISSRQILRYLLERSGLLQDPTVDLIEFRHPSFQDYLAAIEVFRERHLDHLLRNTHDPLYHDVVIMAVGQSQDDPERQRQILDGLIRSAEMAMLSGRAAGQRARDAINYARSIWLLAAACIADVEMVDPDLARKIHAQTRELLPPRDLAEAESVARAGDFVIDLLAETAIRRELTHEETVSTVRVASLIGDDTAISLLRRFRHSSNRAVQAQILAGWMRSSTLEKYANEVLADASVEEVEVNVSTNDYIALLPRLSRLRRLRVSNSQDGIDLGPVSKLTGLEVLDLSDTYVTDISLLSSLIHLEALDLRRTEIVDLTSLAALTRLKELILRRTQVVDLGPLASLTDLEALDLMGTRVQDLRPLASLRKLEALDLTGTPVRDLGWLAGCAQLRALNLMSTDVQDLRPLASLTRLGSLDLTGTAVEVVAPLFRLTNLKTLKLRSTRLQDISPLARITRLQTLDLRESHVRDLTSLSRLTRLQSLDLMYSRVSDLEPLVGLVNLTTLNLRGTHVTDLAPLSGLTSLTNLNLRGTPVADVSPLSGLANLRTLNLMGTRVSDIAPLASLEKLETIDLVGTAVTDIEPLRRSGNLRKIEVITI